MPTSRISKQELEKAHNWADFTADRIISTFPNMEIYTCAAGISPSGVVHFGNFRDVVTCYEVIEALKKKGKKARLLFSWDDYDRFRKVPVGIDESYAEHIGKPLTSVPDPKGEFESYAKRYESAFEETMPKLGIEMEFRRQTELYKAGTYKEEIAYCLQQKDKIGEILYNSMSEKSLEDKGFHSLKEFLADFYPVIIYSRFTNKDKTKVLAYDGDKKIKYLCLETNREDELNLDTADNIKLNWKADWPMRWKFEEVCFEPGGKDHATPGGSWDVSEQISKAVFNRPAPIFVGYDFIGISGLKGKMSSSAGNALSPGELLEVYTPELLMYIYAKTPPYKRFDLSFGSDIYRQYDEMDRKNNNKAIPFRQAVGFGQIADWHEEKLKEMLKKSGMEYSEESISERLPRAKAWLETYNHEEMIQLLEEKNRQYYEAMSDQQKQQIAKLLDYIKSNPCDNIPDLEQLVYSIPKDQNASDEDNKKAQRNFFKDVYNLLIAKDTGPRLATYIWALNKEQLLKLLNFS